MSRLLIILGIVGLVGGIIGMMTSFGAPISNIVSEVDQESITARAEAQCNDDEELETIQGASTYSPTTGWGRPTTFYCVDADGNRRDVTMNFANDMIAGVGDMFGSIFSGSLMWTGVMLGGIALLTVGGIMAFRSGMKVKPGGTDMFGGIRLSAVPPTSPSGTPQQQSGGVYTTNDPQTATRWLQQMGIQTDAAGVANASDLATKLKKLEEARDAGLITAEEYERVRKQILDSMA